MIRIKKVIFALCAFSMTFCGGDSGSGVSDDDYMEKHRVMKKCEMELPSITVAGLSVSPKDKDLFEETCLIIDCIWDKFYELCSAASASESIDACIVAMKNYHIQISEGSAYSLADLMKCVDDYPSNGKPFGCNPSNGKPFNCNLL